LHAVNAMKARHISKILFEVMSYFLFIYRTKIGNKIESKSGKAKEG